MNINSSSKVNVRFGTYNLLNTKDRYDEREQLLKQNLFDLHADLTGIQEVVFGDEMLNELLKPASSRTAVKGHQDGFYAFEAKVQLPIFKLMKNPDPRAQLDGNAILLSENPACSIKKHMVVDHSILHLSGTRNCQLVKIDLARIEDGPSGDPENARYLYFVNCHLHSLLEDDYLRKTQAEMMLFWLDQVVNFERDLVVIVGDFNAKPDSTTYKAFLDAGYTSSYAQIHGKEPDRTFPTGLIAEFMDTDPEGTFDYIFAKGHGFEIKDAKLMSDLPHDTDKTLFGSDHMAVVADFEIAL